jgi:hypothetical protein
VVVFEGVPYVVVCAGDLIEFLADHPAVCIREVVLLDGDFLETDFLGGAPPVFAVGDEAVCVGDDWAAEPATVAYPLTEEPEHFVRLAVRILAINIQFFGRDRAFVLRRGEVFEFQAARHRGVSWVVWTW